MKPIAQVAMALACATLAAAQLPAVKIVEAIAPAARNCDSDNTQCRTAEQAAPWLAEGMHRYGIYSINEMAAVLSLMAFESVDFKYKTNQVPGRPGQGTANMQMAEFNLKYAQSINALKDEVANTTSVDGLSDDQLNNILALVTPDEYNFASGQWFLTTQCENSIREQLKADADQGFAAYMGCVGVELGDDRLAYFTRAKQAFGIK